VLDGLPVLLDEARERVRAEEARLASVGCDPGGVDGVFDVRTGQAFRCAEHAGTHTRRERGYLEPGPWSRGRSGGKLPPPPIPSQFSRRSRVMKNAPSILTATLVAVLLVGCGTVPERQLSSVPSAYATLPNGHDPLNPERLSPNYIAAAAGVEGNGTRYIEKVKGRPLVMLSISGGGQNGAFGAGFLIGWRESGKRPQFDAVGGVSTGALLATHALLGTPEDDAKLEEMYTQVTQKDIYTTRSVLEFASGADSLMDTTPLREMIAKYITAETLVRVAEAAKDNRFLVVGTTNVDYEQTWIWNMTAIAKDGKLDLYRNVLLASASFPIVFPPVEIDGHLFVDGAARSNLVVPGLSGPVRPGPPLYGPGTIYVIDNGKLQATPQALRRALGDVAATTVGVMMNQSMQTAKMRSFLGAKVLGYEFKHVGIEEGVGIGKDPLAFAPNEMRAAFDFGRALGRKADPWISQPPVSDDLPTWATEVIK